VIVMSKRTIQLIAVAALMSSGVFVGRYALGAGAAEVAQPESRPAVRAESPADAQIRKAETVIKRLPTRHDGFNLLAAAYMQKARETGDSSFNVKAEGALARSLEMTSDNIDALNLSAALAVTRHEFAKAVEIAERGRAARPDSPDVYSSLADAQLELGNYPAAIDAAQQMMDLRPDCGSYFRAAYLRILHGETESGAEALIVAIRASDPSQPETVAWCRVRLGMALLSLGHIAEAEREFDLALENLPNYHVALAAKARARVEAGDLEGAVAYYRKSIERVPLPDTAIALGDVLAKLGRTDEAARSYTLAEVAETAGASRATYSRQLALFWADRGERLGEALDIARRERGVRSDVYTCDALAWCLFKTGDVAGARQEMEEALRLGTKDAQLFYHAGMIAEAAGDRARAKKYLDLALSTRVSVGSSTAAFGPLQTDAAKEARARLVAA
jgi:tetratricopeptide (TPR) repeat protein